MEKRFDICYWVDELNHYHWVKSVDTWDEVSECGFYSTWEFIDYETGRMGFCKDVPKGVIEYL